MGDAVVTPRSRCGWVGRFWTWLLWIKPASWSVAISGVEPTDVERRLALLLSTDRGTRNGIYGLVEYDAPSRTIFTFIVETSHRPRHQAVLDFEPDGAGGAVVTTREMVSTQLPAAGLWFAMQVMALVIGLVVLVASGALAVAFGPGAGVLALPGLLCLAWALIGVAAMRWSVSTDISTCRKVITRAATGGPLGVWEC